MITTKRGEKEGLNVLVNSNTMFSAGYIRIPHPQTSYSTGNHGVYDRYDFVWGDKMDIGRTAIQYNPETYQWEEMPLVSKGKDNFKNFLRTGIVSNNTAAVSYKGENGSVRTALNHVYNRGQYPNLQSNEFNYSVAGNFEVGKLKVDGGITIGQYESPQNRGAGYGHTGYVYNFLVWTGTDYDVRDYRNYWQKGKEGFKQNWWNPGWYDNPYFIANESLSGTKKFETHSHFQATYSATDWLKATARLGHDAYNTRNTNRTPIDTRGSEKGYYSVGNSNGFSFNGDFILQSEHHIGDFDINALAGGSIYYYEDYGHSSSTSNGLSIPGFYSLNASVDPVTSSASTSRRQLNSVYGQVSLAWRDIIFLDLNARNDWVSTLATDERSYFYPGINLSFVGSEAFGSPEWLPFWKLRGSWSMTKSPAGVYEINSTYAIDKNLWNNMNGAQYPTSRRSQTLKPEAKNSWEIGTQLHFLAGRLRFDASYYQELRYDLQRYVTVSSATGFSSELVNYGEEQMRKGVELVLSGDIIDTDDWKWTSTINWSLDRYYYHKIDPQYSTDRPWVAAGERWDWMGSVYDWKRDPEGNIIHLNGLPQLMEYDRGGYYENPDWIWGFNNTVQYKNFTLNFSFDGRVGGYGYDRTTQAMWNSGTHPGSDNQWRYDEVVNGLRNYVGQGVKVVSGDVTYDQYGRIVEDTRVFAPNDTPVSYQEYVQTYEPWSGGKRIQNIKEMTFFKLRELSLGYTFPDKLTEKWNLHNLTVSAVGQNLFIWSPNFKYSDPDVGSNNLNSPSMRYVGLNLKFNL